MSTYSDLNQAVTFKFQEPISRYCRTLFNGLNVNQFYYCKITNDGLFGNLDSNVGWADYFTSEKLYLIYPYFCDPRSQQEGVSIIKDSENESLQTVIDAGKDAKFNIQLWVRFVTKTVEGMEEFGFSSGSMTEAQETLFLNELPLLRLFCQKFKMDNEYIFSVLNDSMINMAEIVGPSFYEERIPIPKHKFARRNLLKHLGIDPEVVLSGRERDITKLLVCGFSARKIAGQFHLSTRTVEHHIERIKEKLSCFSKAELVQKAREMEHLNLLTHNRFEGGVV